MRQTSKLRILLLSGGRGAEHDVSLLSAKYVETLLDRDKFLPIPVYISRTGEWLCHGESVSPAYLGHGGIVIRGEFVGIDVALPVLHGDFGEDGVVQGALENAGIAYVGCDVSAGALCSDKAFTKSIARELDIDTARHTVSWHGEDKEHFLWRISKEKLPMFIKPARLGSSIGASVAKNKHELRSAVDKAFEVSDKVMAEELIDVCAELECAYFSALGTEIFSDVGLVSTQDGFYDYDKKYSENQSVTVRADANIPADLSERIMSQSRALADAIGIRHLARFDFLLSRDGRLVFNEINTFPGFTKSSLYPKLIEKAGISPSRLIEMLIYDTVG